MTKKYQCQNCGFIGIQLNDKPPEKCGCSPKATFKEVQEHNFSKFKGGCVARFSCTNAGKRDCPAFDEKDIKCNIYDEIEKYKKLLEE